MLDRETDLGEGAPVSSEFRPHTPRSRTTALGREWRAPQACGGT